MRSPKHLSPSILLMAVVLVSGGFLLRPSASLAASAYQLQADTKIYVESFRTTETTVLPINHADFAAQLTEVIRQQLDDEHRLQTDLRLPALKLVGAIVSYRDSLLNVQIELYDGKQYLAYSRVERQLDPAADWTEDGELIAEQLLDELMSQIKQQPEQVINLPARDCHGYRPTADCNDIERRDWGWWRQGTDEHRDHGAKPPRPAAKRPPHGEHPRHEHDDQHAGGEHGRHPHEKHHWLADEQKGRHQKSPRIEGAVSGIGHPRRETEAALKTDDQITLPEDSGSQTKTGSPIGHSAESGQHSPDKKRHQRESQRDDEGRNSGHAGHVEQPFNTPLQPKSEAPHSAADTAQPTDNGIKSLEQDNSALPAVNNDRLAEPLRQPAITDAVSSPVEQATPVVDAVAPAASPATRSIGTAVNSEDSLSTPISSDSTARISPASSTGYHSDSAAASGGSSASSTSGSSDNGTAFSRSFTAAPSSSSSSGYSSSDSAAASGVTSSSGTSFSSGSGSSASSVSSAPSASSRDESTPSVSPASSPSPQISAPPVSVPTPSPVAAPEPAKPEPEKPAQPASNPNSVKP